MRLERTPHPQDPVSRPKPGAAAVAGAVNEVVRFLLELALLAVFATFGAQLGSSWWSSTLLAIGFGAVFVLSWGALAAPRRLLATPGWFPSVLFVGLTVLAVLALLAMDRPVLAVVLGGLAAVNEVALHLLPSGLRSVVGAGGGPAPRR